MVILCSVGHVSHLNLAIERPGMAAQGFRLPFVQRFGLPNPKGRRDVCPANGVTDQGLGEGSEATGAGNPVLGEE
jgi:hypothetical protein